MKWLNSLDELLYEVMSWLLFFPLTLWRAVFTPIGIINEIDREAALPDDKQYAAVLSPPLFLALALLLGHGLATALGQTDAIIANHHGLAGLVSDTASALILRMIVFASFPLFLAARLVRRRRIRLDRGTLRQPFYEQCYPAAVFALGISVGTSLGLDLHPMARTAGHFWSSRALLIFGSSRHVGSRRSWTSVTYARPVTCLWGSSKERCSYSSWDSCSHGDAASLVGARQFDRTLQMVGTFDIGRQDADPV